MIRFIGINNPQIVGQSHLFTAGIGSQTQSATFLIEIEDITDTYIMEATKRYGESQDLLYESNLLLSTEWDMSRIANIVVVAEYVGQKQ